MASNFSPCKGSYVLNQFPRIVMFGMKGFHVSATGAIQGHHGPLVMWGEGGGMEVKKINDEACLIIILSIMSIGGRVGVGARVKDRISQPLFLDSYCLVRAILL